jgi:uncharacterized delta-60 repeat protein
MTRHPWRRIQGLTLNWHFVISLVVLLVSLPAQSAVEVWARRDGGTAASTDEGHAIVADRDGNVIVAGFTDAGISGRDMLTIKYSGAGAALWTNRYDGPVGGEDEATAVAVDGGGNIFVTGYSRGSSGSEDFLTIAYSATGVPLWTNRFEGPTNFGDSPSPSDERANALALDTNGNVFVTGYSQGSASRDYVTIAYSGAGLALWTNRYDGLTHGADEAVALAVDSTGKVIVTGTSRDSVTQEDCVTIAYSNSGQALWTNRYNGPTSGEDYGRGVAVDASGHAFVLVSRFDGAGSSDFTTIACSTTDGAGVWTNHHNGNGTYFSQPRALAVDNNGNVIVTGSWYNGTTFDYSTVAYSPTGSILWTSYYEGNPNEYDFVQALAVDTNGNVFVTGSSYPDSGPYSTYGTTVAYSPTGVALWTNRSVVPAQELAFAYACAVDGDGKVFVTGANYLSGNVHCLTAAFSPGGAPLWTNIYSRPGHADDVANALAVDTNGNVFVTGYSQTETGAGDYVTIAYTSAGVPLWTNRYGGSEFYDDEPKAMVVDAGGSVIVTGKSDGANYYDYATIKYSVAGVPLWTNRYNGLPNGGDRANAVAVGGNGNVFVTGESAGQFWDDYATVAYSSAGVPLWTNRYNGPGNSTDRAQAIAVAANGNVYLTGYSKGTSSLDIVTIAYTGNGAPLWTNRYDGLGLPDEEGYSIAVAGNGNVYVGGVSGVNNVTLAYSPDGTLLWTHSYRAVPFGFNEGGTVVADTNGNAYVAGSIPGSSANLDLAVIKLSPTGVPLWTNRYDGPAHLGDGATAVAVDLLGNVVVTGHTSGGTSDDYITIAYSSAGVPLWTNRYNGPVNGQDTPHTKSCLAVGLDGSVFVTGASDASFDGESHDFATVKYGNLPLPIPLHIERIANQAVLSWTNAAFRLQSAPAVTALFTNILGATSPTTNLMTGQQQYFRLKAN